MNRQHERLSSETKICLAILKGVVENDDSTRHFGSLGAHGHYCDVVVAMGWCVKQNSEHHTEHFRYEKLVPTVAGYSVYAQSCIAIFENRSGFRWMFWPWHTVTDKIVNIVHKST